MRIPFLQKRKRLNTLYQQGIEDEFALVKRAQAHIASLFMGDREPEMKLIFIFEQVYIAYNLALFAGSHEVSAQARKALCLLREAFEDMTFEDMYVFNAQTALACSKALRMGEAVLQELPRSEFKLAYVKAKKLGETRMGISNYLKVFHD
jgi:hypothetical protein